MKGLLAELIRWFKYFGPRFYPPWERISRPWLKNFQAMVKRILSSISHLFHTKAQIQGPVILTWTMVPLYMNGTEILEFSNLYEKVLI
jgi:hypothetical protein